MEVSLHFSEPLLRRAVRRFWWRTIGWWHVVALSAVGVYLVIALWNGDRSWWVGGIGTMFLIGTIIPAAVYVIHMRRTLAKFREMQSPVGILRLGEDRVGISSDLGTAEMNWSAVTGVWCFPEAWLMFFSRSQFITLPTADLSAEAREFIRAKGEAVGFNVS